MARRAGSVGVVGGGVSGLTSGLCLLDAGLEVTIYFREPPERTTSAVAPAIWHPYLSGPRDRVLTWAASSFENFAALAGDPDTGVRMLEGVEVYRAPGEELLWAAIPPTLRRATSSDLPGGAPDGFVATVPVVDMQVYLGWLRATCERRGARLVERSVDSLVALLDEHQLVVHCAGLGARQLAADTEIEPVRGQVLHVRAPEVTGFLLDGANPGGTTYVIPRTDRVVIGGTSQRGMTSLRPDASTREAMLQRAAALVPALAGAEILDEAVGLRPARPTVRLEVEVLSQGPVVHNYGHGGSGVTISWGCAEEACSLAVNALERRGPP